MMSIMMKNPHLSNCNEIKEFLETNKDFEFSIGDKEERYGIIKEVWFKSKYRELSKKDKRVIIEYLKLLTGYKKSQLMALLKKAKAGRLSVTKYKRHTFSRKYTDSDIALLAKTDECHSCLNAKATKSILKREYGIFDKAEYERLSQISSAQIYILRKTNVYGAESSDLNYTKTTAGSSNSIGERSKPNPNGKPGYVRVDSVHQGDFEGEKGVYHINSVDEVTQWEVVGAVEKISEKYLLPLLDEMVRSYPFRIIEFHSDNGSEYINKQVVKMLNRLLIRLTKSRPRRCNDNALVEGKNGAVVRKHMGRAHIPGSFAELINEFYIKYFNPYLNYHRHCGYPTEVFVSKYGKTKKVYNEYMPPYEKLKSLTGASKYLRSGITFEDLDRIAYSMSDNEAGEEMQKEKDKLFKIIQKKGDF